MENWCSWNGSWENFVLFVCTLCLANTLWDFLQKWASWIIRWRLTVNITSRLTDRYGEQAVERVQTEKGEIKVDVRMRKIYADSLISSECEQIKRDEAVREKFQRETAVLFFLTAMALYTGCIKSMGACVVVAIWPIVAFAYRYYQIYQEKLTYIDSRINDNSYVSGRFWGIEQMPHPEENSTHPQNVICQFNKAG